LFTKPKDEKLIREWGIKDINLHVIEEDLGSGALKKFIGRAKK